VRDAGTPLARAAGRSSDVEFGEPTRMLGHEILHEESRARDGHLGTLSFLAEGGKRGDEVGREVVEQSAFKDGFHRRGEEVHASAGEVRRFVPGGVHEN
jgi:hypothetical protein